ncbi:ABC transporter substrate-binding protein [Propionivibrio sp.]|uniref:ABC transporter substrate-binding protein n=1 Tax=Propionivibrio sp. TaxID=2212460 RepID=UPI003BEFFA6A
MIFRDGRFLSNSQLSWGARVCRPLFLLAVCVGLFACNDSDRGSLAGNEITAEARLDLARQRYKARAPVVMTAVWNQQDGEFLAGAQLAAEEINAEGGINGRVLQLETLEEEQFVSGTAYQFYKKQGRYRNEPQFVGTTMAKTVLRNPDITAVVGHSSIPAILPAMVAYNNAGVLFFGGGSSDSRILWSSTRFYFQFLPHDVVLAKTMTQHMNHLQWGKVYFIYEADRHSEQLVELLRAACASANIRFGGAVAILSDTRSNNASTMRMQKSIAALRKGDIDGLVVIANSGLAAHIVRESRMLGLLQPFMLTPVSNPRLFTERVGLFGENVRLVTLRRDAYQVDEFHKRFMARFPDKTADIAASQGYDSVQLYADAVAIADSTDPTLVANVLHYRLTSWSGLLGNYTFVDREVQNVKYYVRRLVRQKDGELTFVKDGAGE